MKKSATILTIFTTCLIAVGINAQENKEEIVEKNSLADQLTLVAGLTSEEESDLVNPRIDAEGYILETMEAVKHRESRRVSEEKFIEMSEKDNVIILDTRSRLAYDIMHVEGSINLPFSDMSYATLAAILPDKDQTILIYCNNNFKSGGLAFLSKTGELSLNVPTYTQLYGYGYRNIYELAEYLDVKETKIEMSGAGIDSPELLEAHPSYYAQVGAVKWGEWQAANPQNYSFDMNDYFLTPLTPIKPLESENETIQPAEE